MKRLFYTILALAVSGCATTGAIDRESLVARNNPHITAVDTLASLTVGNGGFAFTVDVTGLQSMPERYRAGVPLGTQSWWGWHEFPNTEHFEHSETLCNYDFGRGHSEPYSVQHKEAGRGHDAAEWYRANPHRLHLGTIGFDGITSEDIGDIDQRLDMWRGVVESSFTAGSTPYEVQTSCDPAKDMVAVAINTAARRPVTVRFAYPTGGHSDDACDWSSDDRHSTEIVSCKNGCTIVRRTLDETTYYVKLYCTNAVKPVMRGANELVICPTDDRWTLTVEFSPEMPAAAADDAAVSQRASAEYWESFWRSGAAVDFSRCTDPRAAELERRTVLSQYLLAAQCAGPMPPQETGLTYNSWFGKFHLEMLWWHEAQFALWGRGEMLARTMTWYGEVAGKAREIATRQGFDGVRWMKMTDPSGREAPSNVGSFLVWQQPHPIYLAELLYRAAPTDSTLDAYYDLVQQSAQFMCSFAEYDNEHNQYILRGVIPAQETLRAAETANPPFELAYWHFGLSTAQKWRERRGEPRNAEWDRIIGRLSPLAQRDGLYLAAESANDTYRNVRFTSDHMAVLAALGVLPLSPLVDAEVMRSTLHWVCDNWNWERTWGWDYPLTAMCAARLGEPEMAVDVLLAERRTNTWLPNGHNFQDRRLRCYLPGNGGLLTAVAMMCAGWDGSKGANPGFPDDGTWNVRWEGLEPMP